MGWHAFLQGIFLIQRLNLGLLHGRRILYHLSQQGSPLTRMSWYDSSYNPSYLFLVYQSFNKYLSLPMSQARPDELGSFPECFCIDCIAPKMYSKNQTQPSNEVGQILLGKNPSLPHSGHMTSIQAARCWTEDAASYCDLTVDLKS